MDYSFLRSQNIDNNYEFMFSLQLFSMLLRNTMCHFDYNYLKFILLSAVFLKF